MAATVALLGVALPGTPGAADPVAGSAGIDTSAPLTDSKLTLSGRGRFSELRVTVNQTKQLANQALSVTWTGGKATTDYGQGGSFGEHFLQMFQCWGDDDGSNPENPGPPPHQCVQGATNGVFGGSPAGALFQGSTSLRVISQRGAPNFDPSLGELDEFGAVSLPFRAVDGTVVPQWRNTAFNPQLGGGSYWLNSFFDINTTNEIAGARTAANGKGAALFEATTGLESAGLGCGQRVQKQADGSTKIPKCWLVAVPRGGAAEENEGAGVSQSFGVSTSPLAPAAWRNRIAVPLEFNPLDSPCELSAEQRRIVGSELLSVAVSSWQPALCATPGLSPYAYGAVSESRARQQLVSGTTGAPGMAVVSRPLDSASLDAKNPVIYAPLTVSGTVVGFNLERLPRVIFPAGEEPAAEVLAAEEQLRSVRVADLNLTPRLMAKLLTQSYRSQVEIAASKPPYPWSTKNPFNAGGDPDFLQFNPEFKLLETTTKNTGGLVMPGPNSDAALQMWEWIFADPEARTWLAGAPDPWGMNVNPVYSTVAAVNPQGAAFGDPLPDLYPKSDPYCYQGPALGSRKVVPPSLCGLDWLPYAQGVRDSARATRAANDGARTEVNPEPLSADQVYRRDPPQAPGKQAILSITDTASAAQYGLQTARLSRAGDNGANRTFIAANSAGLAAGGQALAAKAVPGFLEPNPTAASPSAYPLTAITYAAVTPLSLDATARKEYAAFVDYAAGPGQLRGFEYGRLPAGYQPLPEALSAQGKEAATKIRELRTAGQDEDSATSASGNDEGTGGNSADSSQTGTDGASGANDGGNDGAAAPTQSPGSRVSLQPQGNPQSTSPLRKIVDAISTPISELAGTRYALPVLLVVAALTALGALEISRRRSRLNAPADGARPLDVEQGTG